MRYIRDLYIANTLRGFDAADLLARIDRGDACENAYLITLSTNPDNQLDIIHTLFLRQKALRKYTETVVGIAPDRYEANVLVEEILHDTMEKTGGMDMRGYLGRMETVDTSMGHISDRRAPQDAGVHT